MDALHFDRLVRSLALRSTSRRQWLAGLITLPSVLPQALAGEAVEAKHKGHRHHHRHRKHKKPSCIPSCTGQDCADDGCGKACTCSAAKICFGPGGQCCDPEGTPCTGETFRDCCSQCCDFLVGGGTCCPCAGQGCNADFPCCGGLDCIDGSCDGCHARGQVCFSPEDCCFSDCTSGMCLSASGGPCVHDRDCRACYFPPHNCTNTCVDGSCAF